MSEEVYCRCLDCERLLYAWCLSKSGGWTAEEPERKAREFYEYEPPDSKHRDLVFHKSAWDWAMFHVHGDGYWIRRPELAKPPEDFDREYDRVYGISHDGK